MPGKGLHKWLLSGVSAFSLRDVGHPSPLDTPKPSRQRRRRDRSSRPNGSPLVFETLEPRVLLSGDPLTAAAQVQLLAGLEALQSWSHDKLDQSAQLVQQLPVVSTSVGQLVDLPGALQQHVVKEYQSYLSSTNAPTVEGLAAYLSQDPAETGAVLGSFSQASSWSR